MKNCRNVLEISPAFIAFLCAYYYFDPGQTFFPFLISVLLHEAGHLLALWPCGAKIRKLKLEALGASMITEPLSWGREFLAAAAGPLVNLLLFLLTLRKFPPFSMVNLCLLCFNLLPVFPLDGGRMLRALLSLFLTDRQVYLSEQIIGGLFFLLFLWGAVWLTCCCHAGLWPILTFGLLFLRIAWAQGEERRIFRLGS